MPKDSVWPKSAPLPEPSRGSGTRLRAPLYMMPPGYRVEHITDPERLKDLFRLRYRWYVEQMGSVPAGECVSGMETDAFDLHADHFGAYCGAKLVGMFRLLRPMNDQFLIETGAEAFPLPQDFPRETAREISRTIAPQFVENGLKVSRQIHAVYHAALEWSLAQGITHWPVAMRDVVYNRFAETKWPMRRLNAADRFEPYHHIWMVPVLIDLRELKREIFPHELTFSLT
jgi:N-acyl-L-homoserine lactone synthetase